MHKIDPIKLSRLLSEGKTQTELAREFKVSKTAVSLAAKRLKLAATKDIALRSAGKIVEYELNLARQLGTINNKTTELLNLLSKFFEGDPEAKTRMLEISSLPRTVNTDPRLLYLKCLAQIESQLKTQLEIYRALFDLKGVVDFQNSVLDTIGSVDPQLRECIIEKLKAARQIGSALKNF